MFPRKLILSFVLFILVLLISGCGYVYYYGAQYDPIELQSGEIDMDVDFIFWTAHSWDRYSFINFNRLNYSEYAYFELSFRVKSPDTYYEITIDSIYVSFSDSTEPYRMDWIYNKSYYYEYRNQNYSNVMIAPIYTPYKYEKDFYISFNANVHDFESKDLVESKRIDAKVVQGRYFYHVLSNNNPAP